MAAETVKVDPADSEQDEEEDVYEVERIIDMRVEEGEVLYRVRWKNYCSDDDTWEPEAHLEDCREVLLAFKKAMADAKAKKEAEAKKNVKLLPMKSDVFDAESESDSDKERPTDLPMKKKKKTKILDEESPPKEKKKKKKKDKRMDDFRPVPAPETDDEEEMPPTPPSPPKEMKIELKKRLVESDEDEDTPVPTKKHRKEKGKEEGKHKKDKVEEKKKKKGKKEKRADSSDEEAAARMDDDASDVPSEAQMEGATDAAAHSTEKAQPDDKAKPKRGKWEVKLRGIKDLIHEKKNKKPDAALKDSSLLKLKSLTSRGKDEAALHSDSSDSSTLLKKTKSKGQESTSAPPKTPSSSTSSSSSSSVTAAGSTKGKEDEVSKEEVLAPKDATGSTNLFEKFLLNCEAKDRAPRRQPTHPPTSEKSSAKPTKLVGKTEKIPKSNRDSPAQKPEPKKTDKTKQSDVPRPGQSHGFSLDSDEREGEDSAAKQRPGEEPRERRERTEETQRPGWERRASADDRRKRREDSEPRAFLTCDDSQETQDPPESAEKSEKGQTTLSLGMDLNLDWMTLDDFQKHLNGEDEILSGPPLSPSELRDAVKIGDYMSVKLALNSKEDYNLDQEACTIGETKSFEGERSLIEERSSSDALRLTSGLDSAQNEEVTPRVKGIVPQDLDGPKDGIIMPSCPDSTNNEQVTMREHEKIHKYGRDVTEFKTTACDTAIVQESQGSEDQKSEQEDESPDDTESDLSSKISLNFDHSNGVKTTEGMMTSDADKSEQNHPANKQHSPEEEHGSSIERESVAVGQPDSTDHGLFESATKEMVKARSLQCRKTVEKKLPTRSSSRTSKKVVETTSVVHEKKESYKKHFCLYCKMAFAHLAKHLEKKHAEETDVSHAIHFPKGSKVRQNLLDQIRNKGDYEHNCQVLRSGRGEIVTQKQMKTPSVSVRDFLPCQHCFAFYRKADLWRHERSCKVRKGDQKSSERTKTSGVHSAASRLLPMAEFLTEGCREIINIMHQDDISKLIRKDPLICKYGNALSVKYDHDKSQFAYIAQKMRELGRFVHAVNQLDNNVNYLHEVCQPSRFELAVEGAKKVSGFDPSSSKFKTVSLVSKIGYSLKRAAEIAFGESRMTEDSETESEVKMFIQLLDTKWSECFSRRSLALSLKQEVKKVEVDKSCVTEDLIKLHRFIIVEEDEARRDLKGSPSLSTWKKLSEATLADVCLFNRGRVGNIGRMLLRTYTHKKSKGTFVPSADQIRKSTKLERELGSNFTSLELEGQYGRNMLVLLTERMVLSIDLLIENRGQAGVSETNQYLFARAEGPSFIRGLDCFRRAAMESGVTNAEALLCPSLRERIASCWQLMSLSEHELDQVAMLLGWSSQDCYRLSENASQLEEVSQQLLKMDQTLPSSPHGTAKDGATQKSTLKRRPWSEKEQVAVKRYLCEYITEMKVPGKKECNACIAAEPDLCGRSWTDVKNYVHNTLQTIRRRNNQLQSEEIISRSPKARGQITTNNLEDGNIVHGMTTGHPDHLTEGSNCCMTMAPLGSLREASPPFPQEMTPSYPSLCSTSTNMVLTSQPLVSTFTPLNATDTQVVPTFTPHNTTNALMPPAYTSENSMMLTLSPLYTQNATSMPPPSVYAQDTTSSPIIPSYSTFNAPSTSVMPTFTQLDTPSSPMVPAFSTLNNRSGAIISSFSPLNQPSMTAYPTNPPMGPATAQVVPTVHRSSVPDRTQGVQGRTPTSTTDTQAVKPQKRVKRLWGEEEQAAVRRQFGDLCKLVKVPGKKDCDACLAAEPALSSRTWREVKYFVHNSIQSLKRKGHAVASKQSEGEEPETQTSNAEWDGPVYLSL